MIQHLTAVADFDRPAGIPRPAQIAGIAGEMPFIAIALAAWIPDGPIPLASLYLAGFVYAAVVLSFIAGARWGAAGPQNPGDIVAGILPPLAGWIAPLILPLLGLCLLIAAFFLQALWNVVSADRGTLPSWFGKLSSLITAGAVIALVTMLFKLLT